MADNSDLIDAISDGSDPEYIPSCQLRKTKSGKKTTKKVSAEWNDDAIGKLILCVETRQCLWNAQLNEYRNKNHRDAAWKEISEIFEEKYSANELSAKWANLRIQFKSYSAKFKKTESGQATGEYQVHWRFFKPMLFILSAETEQSTQSESNLVSKIVIFIIFKCMFVYKFLYCHGTSPS